MSSPSSVAQAARPRRRGPVADPLPPPLTSDVEGSWAYDTMSRRVASSILSKLRPDNGYAAGGPEDAGIAALEDELAAAATTPLRHIADDPAAPDVATWREVMAPAVEAGQTWLSAPWVLAEFYLYRRVLEAVGYFSTLEDPFQKAKDDGLEAAAAATAAAAAAANAAVALGDDSELELMILLSLWGNRMDLSLWPASGTAEESAERSASAVGLAMKAGAEALLWDGTAAAAAALRAPGRPREAGVVVDNAGFELVADLCLADYLVACGAADTVTLHVKAHPTFVSDAMEKDVMATVAWLEASPDAATAEMGARWRGRAESGEWRVRPDFYWVQPQPFWEMPGDTTAALEGSSVVFVKGDANYRRLIGERDWAFDTPFEDVAGYFPCPVCALRTLKAELGCGMDPAKVEAARARDDDWLVAGKYGVVQFCDPAELD